MASCAIRATKGGEPVTPKQLGHGTIGGTDFYGEAITLSGSQKIELRKLLMDFGMTVSAEELGAAGKVKRSRSQPHSESRCARWRCRSPRLAAQPAGSAGSSSGRKDASRP